MKLCIPVAENNGAASEVYGHFGSAPVFAIHDTESNDTVFMESANQHHPHGACQPLKALGGESVDAIVVSGIGAWAVMRLNEEGIKVYRATPGTLQEVVAQLVNGSLAEIALDEACSHHGGCDH